MNKVTVLGSLNVDTILKINRLPKPGETMQMNSKQNAGGGKGANQAIAAARCGAKTSFIGKIGNDANGAMMLELLKEAEIDKVLKNKQRDNSVVYTVDDRPARMGDQAILNFNARCGGKDIPGGQSRSYPLLLGSHTFVKGFEEAVAGHSIGDRFEIRVTFPADYRIADLRQKEVIYHVHLTGLRIPEYQEINDEFARDFSEYETLADWRNAIREELAERHELSAYQKLTRELLDQVIADSSVPVDRDLLQDLAEDLYDDFLYDLEDSNMTLEKYCKRTGKNKYQIIWEKDGGQP